LRLTLSLSLSLSHTHTHLHVAPQFAGTDADVHITLWGEDKDGAETQSPVDLPLANSKNNFERNMTDVFDLAAMADLGELTRIRIGHNGKGLGAGWHMDHVEVFKDTDPSHVWYFPQPYPTHGVTYALPTRYLPNDGGFETNGDFWTQRRYFPASRWFDTSEPPKQVVQTLPVAVRDADAKTAEYKITVYTSDIKFGGTDAGVFVTLFGAKGSTGSIKLANSKNNFERGSGKISLPQPLASLLITPQRVTTWRVYRGSALA
jgi:hypothetical protein